MNKKEATKVPKYDFIGEIKPIKLLDDAEMAK